MREQSILNFRQFTRKIKYISHKILTLYNVIDGMDITYK